MVIPSGKIQNIIKVYGEQAKIDKPVKNNNSPPAGSQSDEVVISPQAQEFSQVLQQVRKLPAVRDDKVQEIADRINAGTYKVDSQAVAAKMLERLAVDRRPQ